MGVCGIYGMHLRGALVIEGKVCLYHIVSIYVILIASVHLLYKARYCNIGFASITLLNLIVLD